MLGFRTPQLCPTSLSCGLRVQQTPNPIQAHVVRLWKGALDYYFRKMCSSSEAGSYVSLTDFVYHSTLGLRVLKQKRRERGFRFSRKRVRFRQTPNPGHQAPRPSIVERGFGFSTWKVNVRLPGTGNSNSHGARPVHQIISMIKWIRTNRSR